MCYSESYIHSTYLEAKKRNPQLTSQLRQIYITSDMSQKEFMEHLRILAYDPDN